MDITFPTKPEKRRKSVRLSFSRKKEPYFKRDIMEKISCLFGCIICFPGYSVVEGIFFISNSNEDPEVKSTQSQSEEKELLLIVELEMTIMPTKFQPLTPSIFCNIKLLF